MVIILIVGITSCAHQAPRNWWDVSSQTDAGPLRLRGEGSAGDEAGVPSARLYAVLHALVSEGGSWDAPQVMTMVRGETRSTLVTVRGPIRIEEMSRRKEAFTLESSLDVFLAIPGEADAHLHATDMIFDTHEFAAFPVGKLESALSECGIAVGEPTILKQPDGSMIIEVIVTDALRCFSEARSRRD